MNESKRIVDIERDLLLALVTLDSGKPAKQFLLNMQLKMFIFCTHYYIQNRSEAIVSDQRPESLD